MIIYLSLRIFFKKETRKFLFASRGRHCVSFSDRSRKLQIILGLSLYQQAMHGSMFVLRHPTLSHARKYCPGLRLVNICCGVTQRKTTNKVLQGGSQVNTSILHVQEVGYLTHTFLLMKSS